MATETPSVAPPRAEVPMVDAEVVRQIRELHRGGWGAKRIARELEVARNTVRRYLLTELCALYGVSRKTGYKWIDRYVRHGPAGLEEASRRPRRSPNQTPERCREEGEPDAPAHRLPREPLFRARARRHGSVEGAREAGECRPSRPLRRARAAREHACHACGHHLHVPAHAPRA